MQSAPKALAWRVALVLAVAGALAMWILAPRSARRAGSQPAPAANDAEVKREPQWRPRKRAELSPGCQPESASVCIRGDAWWVDSCGQPYEMQAECGLGLCVDGACEAPPLDDCGGLPPIGRCEANVAEVCAAGRPMSVDCSADGRRCVMTEEGPLCRDVTADDCAWPPGATRCELDTLVTCHEGRLRKMNCAGLNASCVSTGPISRCVGRVPASYAEDGCGPCGCVEGIAGEEVCDGRDNDGDGHIDEDGCDPVDIVAFVITDARGNSSYTEEDLATEVAKVNAAFEREDGYGLEFVLADTVWVANPDLLDTDEVEFDRLVDTMVYPTREAFYVPILFADTVSIEGIPRPGVSTVPNGNCGGSRIDPVWQPLIGLIAIAKRRWKTTVAHEVGHFLGLCHTHGDHLNALHNLAATEADGDPEGGEACDPICELEADGICDTPPDPGPSTCSVGEACTIMCESGEVPDGRNLMGYYTACRSVFSKQQALLMRRMLALRRGWHPCSAGGCPCDPVLADCPEQMSCRPLATKPDAEPAWACGMDGASVPGGTCADGRDCSAGSNCMTAPSGVSLCIRPCSDETEHCDCQELPGNPWPVCVDDLARAQLP